MQEEQLRKIVYALTLEDRAPEKRSQWLRRGFKLMHASTSPPSDAALLAYWQKRIASSPEDAATAMRVWEEYQSRLQDIRKDNTRLKGISKAKKTEDKEASKEGEQEADGIQRPGVLGQIKSFAKAIVSEGKAIGKGEPPLDADTIAKRLAICAECKYLGIDGLDRCQLCGCFVAAKARFRTQSCPAGKW